MLNTKIIILSIGFFGLLGTVSCSDSPQENVKSKSKSTFKLNNKLDQNQRVKEYFDNLNSFIDEYVLMIEELAENQKSMEGKEPNMTDAFEAMTTTANALSKMEPYLTKMEELEKESELLQKELSQDELKLFVESYTKLLLRFQEASQKINQ